MGGRGDRPTLLAYCKVAFGIGHWMRMATLVRALQQSFRVVLVLDGTRPGDLEIPAGIDVVDLVLSPKAHPRERGRQLVEAVHREAPDVLLLEYFPFGRHASLFELQTMLHEATVRLAKRPLIVSSLRDIAQQARAGQVEFDARACDLCNRYFDAVLVHADPRIAHFEASFAPADKLTIPVIHTGYVVADDDSKRMTKHERVVLVSVGGGLGGEGLLRAALAAARTTDLTSDYQIRVIAGTFQTDTVWRELEPLAAALNNVSLRRWVPDLRRELASASVSVSRCGYNTALDLLRTRTPALVVPFATGEEDEQMARARKLESLGAVRVLPEPQATPARLAQEIRRTERFEPHRVSFAMNGAQRSTEILHSLLAKAGRRGAAPSSNLP